jgi:hypothetical protein
MNEKEQNALLEHCFSYFRKKGFPYSDLSEKELNKDWISLKELNSTEILKGNLII